MDNRQTGVSHDPRFFPEKSGDKNIYDLGEGIWTVSELLIALYELEGLGISPWGTPTWCHWMCLIIRKKNISGLGMWTQMVSEIIGLLWSGVGHDPGTCSMAPGEPLKPSCKTSYRYLSYPQVSKQIIERLLKTCPGKIWADFACLGVRTSGLGEIDWAAWCFSAELKPIEYEYW